MNLYNKWIDIVPCILISRVVLLVKCHSSLNGMPMYPHNVHVYACCICTYIHTITHNVHVHAYPHNVQMYIIVYVYCICILFKMKCTTCTGAGREGAVRGEPLHFHAPPLCMICLSLLINCLHCMCISIIIFIMWYTFLIVSHPFLAPLSLFIICIL